MLKPILRQRNQDIITQRIILILSLIIVMGLFVFSSKGASANLSHNGYSKTTANK